MHGKIDISLPSNFPSIGPIACRLWSLPLVGRVEVKSLAAETGQFEKKQKTSVFLHVFQIFCCASTSTLRTSRSFPAQRRASLATRSSSTTSEGASGECPNRTGLWFPAEPGVDWLVQTVLHSTGPVSRSRYRFTFKPKNIFESFKTPPRAALWKKKQLSNPVPHRSS